MTEPRTAVVALLGAPNAGKSTLLNRLIGARLAIVSPKAQTTRFALRGIRMVENTQLIFIDTPGIFRAEEHFGKAMVRAAWQGALQADITLLVVDATRKNSPETARKLLQHWQGGHSPVALVINKVDRLEKAALLPLTAELAKLHDFTRVFMVSALEGDGVEDLTQWLCGEAKTGPWLYPEDQLSDINERLLAAETTREQLFLQLREEVPYGLMVDTEAWEETAGEVKIWQVIYVEREAHKAIVLGASGRRIRDIGTRARQVLEGQLGRKTHLFLHVKVKEDWKSRPEFYRAIGLEF